MKEKTNLWYWLNGANKLNLGEQLAPEIMKYFDVDYKEISLSDKDRDHDKWGNQCLYIIGSCLMNEPLFKEQINRKHLHIWGIGAGSYGNNPLKIHSNMRIHAVRGPLTRKIVELDEKIPMGDPGFIIPYIIPLTKHETDRVTYVPHHSTLSQVNRKSTDVVADIGANDYINVMSERGNLENTLNSLASSKFVLTSTLHTAILCISYGIPWAPIQIPGEVIGGGHHPIKWLDVMKWLNIPDEQFYFVKDYKGGIAWWETVGSKIKIPDLEPLIKSFPFNKNVI